MATSGRILSLLVVCSLATIVSAQQLTTDERERLLLHLETTRHAFLASVEGLSDAQWNYRAAEGRWSIAEVAEHIAASESLLRGYAEGAMKSPSDAEMLKKARREDFVLQVVPDRSQTFQAPEPLRPTNRFGSAEAALQTFRAERVKTIDMAGKGGDLRAHAALGPGGNPLDAYSWLLFVSAHSERHTKQISEVRADPGFPKN